MHLIAENVSKDVEKNEDEDLLSEIQARIQQGMKKNQAIKEIARFTSGIRVNSTLPTTTGKKNNKGRQDATIRSVSV